MTTQSAPVFTGPTGAPAVPGDPIKQAEMLAGFRTKVDATLLGAASGVALLDVAGNVVSASAPSGGDDYAALSGELAAMEAAGGGVLILQAGQYWTSQKLNPPAAGSGYSRVALLGQGMGTTFLSPLATLDALLEVDEGFIFVSGIGFTNVSNRATAGIRINANNVGVPIRVDNNSFISFAKGVQTLKVNNFYLTRNFFNGCSRAATFECVGGFVLETNIKENYVLGGSGFDFPVPPADSGAPNGSYHTEGANIVGNTVLPATSTAPSGAATPFGLRIQAGLDITSRGNTYGQNDLGDAILLDAVTGFSVAGSGISLFTSESDWIDGGSSGGVTRHGVHILGGVFYTHIDKLKVTDMAGYGVSMDGTTDGPVAGVAITNMRTLPSPGNNGLGDIGANVVENLLITGCQLNHPTASIVESAGTVSAVTNNVWTAAPVRGTGSTYASNIGPAPTVA